MIKITHEEYCRVLKKFTNKPFELSVAYIDYQRAKGFETLFFADQEKMILCWGKLKKTKVLGTFLDVHGLIFEKSTSQKQLKYFFAGFKKLPYQGVFINSSLHYSALFEESIRNAGFKRPIGQTSTNLSVMIDLLNFKPDTNWKRNLKKASAAGFQVKIKENVSKSDSIIIERLHAENSKLKNLNYKLNSNEIIRLCQGSNIKVFFIEQMNKPIAARIISVEEDISYDIFACHSLESRNNGATQFLMQKIFDDLCKSNIRYFDFSRIPVGKRGGKGVYDFKKSTRGKTIQYNGEWVFFKNRMYRHLYFLYNAIVNRKDFY